MPFDTLIDESITVWAFFDSSTGTSASSSLSDRGVEDMNLGSGQVGIFPIAMNWRRRLVKFQKLIFISSRKVGEVKILSLVCSSDSANFELEYNTQNNLWKLKKVMSLE